MEKGTALDGSSGEGTHKSRLVPLNRQRETISEPAGKDEAETKLEKLIFGDDAGFRETIQHFHRQASFGSHSDELISEDGKPDDDRDLTALADEDLFFIDSGPTRATTKDLPPVELEGEGYREADADSPVWVDSDDERITVSLTSNPRLRKLRVTENEDLINGREYIKRLQRQFEWLHPLPDWANPAMNQKGRRKKRRRLSASSEPSNIDASEDEMSVDEDNFSAQPLAKIMNSLAPLIPSSASSTPAQRRKLRPEIIDIQRSKDVGDVQPSTITALQFHPQHPLLLSSGPSSLISLHHISPSVSTPNPLLTSLHIHSTSISTAAYHPSGYSIFFSGRQHFFHVWNLASGKVERISRIYGHKDDQRTMEHFKLSPCGRYMALIGTSKKNGGLVNVLSAQTCQWVCQVRVEGRGGVADLAWWSDGEGIVVISKSGECVEYSISEKRVLERWIDEGSVGSTVIALGGKIRDGQEKVQGLGGDRWVAVGSQSGIVNVYDRRAWAIDKFTGRPKPKRVLDHLVTPISHLHFSNDGQLLVIASRWKKGAIRLVHLPSCTVYRNWPTSGTPTGRISAIAMNPTSDVLAIANEQGKIHLWEVRG